MNPRQRRGVLLMIVAALGAVAVFVLVLSYVGQVRAQVGNMRTVLRLTQDVNAYEEISPDMVEPVRRPAKWTSDTMFRDAGPLQGKVAAADLPSGTYLQKGSVIPSPTLQPDQREIAILIDAETGVAGKVEAGSVVDIYATFAGTEQEASACSVQVMSNARVLSVGQLQRKQGGASSQTEQDQVVPLTFALSPQEINRLMYAESFSDTLRLARVGELSEKLSSVEPQCEVPRSSEASEDSKSGERSSRGRESSGKQDNSKRRGESSSERQHEKQGGAS